MKLPIIAFTTLFCASVAFAQDAAPAAKKPMTAEDQMKRYDKDADGAVTLEEYSAYTKDAEKDKAKAKFEKRDKNKDGKLTLEEISGKKADAKEGASEKASD